MRVLDPTIQNDINFYIREQSDSNDCDAVATLEGTNTTENLEVIIFEGSTNVYDLTVRIAAETFSENQSVSLKVTSNRGTNIVYRGKMFFTSQVPQNYNING